MTGSQLVAGSGLLVLGVDTCGASGTVALAKISSGAVEVLGQTELAGKTYSATLVSAVDGLLSGHGVKLAEVAAIVAVHGPGSFTGVRVGLSAVKGLAEPGQVPVAVVSRLEVLAAKAGVNAAALDAHRHEVFLRVGGEGGVRELLAGAEELSQISKSRCGAPSVIAVCEDAAAGIVTAAWSGVELVRVKAPTAVDAIERCSAEILVSHPFGQKRRMDGAPGVLNGEESAGRFVDVAMLDGHYLRRSDAEIFGEAAERASGKMAGLKVRRMEAGDLDGVMGIAAETAHAPRWGRQAYVDAINPEKQPRRVALVAEREEKLAGFVVAAIVPGGEAELESIVTAVSHQRRGVARELFGVLKTELRRQGVAEVMLEVRDANHSAQGFYRFMGFREEGRRKGYYLDPVEDAILMRVRLT